MDKNEAWNVFAKRVKIKDYLKYREIANEAEHGRSDNTGNADG